MRILLHGFAGYPYPVQLSRALARRGHEVLHVYCDSLETTPGGGLQRQPDDPGSFEIEPITLSSPLAKYNFLKRFWQENVYGRRVADSVRSYRPDVVISANSPLDSHRWIQSACRETGARFVFWVQDLIGIATHRILREKIPLVGEWIGRYYLAMERRQLDRSDAAVLLTADFEPILDEWGIDAEKTHVVENWAPLAEFPLRSRDNEWAREMDLVDKRVLLYAGTMGMKHNPEFLFEAAKRYRDEEDVRIVVLSEGLGADWLREKKAEHGLENLILHGFLPFEMMPTVMATADVLVGVLEPEAGVFSVPSKVLAYLCSQRPILLAVPPENLIARIVGGNEAGLVVGPDDTAGFLEAADRLLQDAGLRERLGANGRSYAEETFDIERIADRFEAIIARTAE